MSAPRAAGPPSLPPSVSGGRGAATTREAVGRGGMGRGGGRERGACVSPPRLRDRGASQRPREGGGAARGGAGPGEVTGRELPPPPDMGHTKARGVCHAKVLGVGPIKCRHTQTPGMGHARPWSHQAPGHWSC